MTEIRIHTNGFENFWSLLKRAIKGTYVNVEPFDFLRYLDEEPSGTMSARTMTRRSPRHLHKFLTTSSA